MVLKGSEGEISDADLQTAADLAAHFSRSRGNKKVPVVMVPPNNCSAFLGWGQAWCAMAAAAFCGENPIEPWACCLPCSHERH